LRDHLLNFYLTQSHKAVEQAATEGLIQPVGEQEAGLIIKVQQLIEQQLGQFAQELAQIDQAAQQFAPQPQMPQDSSLQVAQISAQLKGQEMQQRAAVDQARLQLDSQKLQTQQQTEAQKLAAQQQAAQDKLQSEMFRQEQENLRTAENNAARERMNTSDNETAMLLAAAEMATGEKVSISTGTGINPNP
jgi:hypothetical protein